MKTLGPNFDIQETDAIWTSPCPADTKTMGQDSRGSVARIAGRHATANGSAGRGLAVALSAADWLCLAATPTFAIMALVTGFLGGGHPSMLCSAAQNPSPLSGMVPMYLLMSAFHSASWLKLISRR
jgi:hypothetical protein